MKQKVDYANWVPKKLVQILGTASVAIGILLLLSFIPNTNTIWLIVRIILGIGMAFFGFFFFYMAKARKMLSYEGGSVQGKILDNVISYLKWNGDGKVLDIGCGSGAMAIKIAKKYPESRVTGIDYWGAGWDYAKKQCEQNAKIEKVYKQIDFQKGDASKLAFPDEMFDAAVSNFVFHEVRTQPDKTTLIKEALRVIKKGGSFSFGDVYFSKGVYKDLDKMLDELAKEVSEIHFVDTRKSSFVPRFLQTPLIVGEMGLIYGRK